jgi:flagellar hook-associated protein FlgK
VNQEAGNMRPYQHAYASAKVVTTINGLLYTVINMGTLTA